ncbi:MAG: hypothetical protein K9M08_21975 [Pirellula sp.]|nr:hypothetical protein [Pirellula sp.]
MMSHLARPVSTPTPSIPMVPPKILWIDGVGSYAICDQIEVAIGQAFPGNQVDLAIRGDISRRAAIVRRHGEDHLIQPLQTVHVNGSEIDRAVVMHDGDLISLGARVGLRYVRPTQLSGTARLELTGNSRWQPLLSAALLMGESCVLGPESNCHVICPDWSSKVVLFRNGAQWMCRVSDQANIQIDGKPVRAPFPLVRGQRITGDEISMTLE